jgi:hypothetical protein
MRSGNDRRRDDPGQEEDRMDDGERGEGWAGMSSHDDLWMISTINRFQK